MDASALKDITPKIVAAGMATVDNIYWLPNHPAEDSENPAARYRSTVGAPAGRGAVAAARLGIDVVLVATMGQGPFAGILESLLAEEPVRTCLSRFGVESQQSCVLVATDSAARTTIWTGHPAADEATCRQIREELATATVALTDITDEAITRAVIDGSRASGALVVVDTGDYALEDPALLRGVDFVIASEAFAVRLANGASLVEWAEEFRRGLELRLVAVTQGRRGGFWVDGQGSGRWTGVEVEVVDTCGAGDAFHGGFAWAIAQGFAEARAFDIAAWVAARHVSGYGNDGLPAREALLAAGLVSAAELRS